MNTEMFPDLIAYRDNFYRVVTADGRSWLCANTTLNRRWRPENLRPIVRLSVPMSDDMREDGLIVLDRTQHQPPLVEHPRRLERP